MRVVCIALVAASTAILTGTPPRYDDVVVDDLRLELTIDYARSRLEARAGLRIVNLGTESVNRLPIRLGRLMRIQQATSHSEVLTVTQDVVRFPDWDQMQVLEAWIELPSLLHAGDTLDLSIEYEGTVTGYVETGMTYVRDRIAPDFTLIRSDAFSFPTLGPASLTSMRSARPHDFTFSGSVAVQDSSLVLASAGTLGVEPGAGDSRIWRFASSGPAPFLLLAIAPYESLETAGTRIYHFGDDRQGAQRLAEALATAEELYSDWFGPRPGSTKATVMEIPEGWGSQASLTGGIIQTADAFRRGEELTQLYHELAHLWHPPEVERPADRWNEGLATFLQWRVIYHLEPDSLVSRIQNTAGRIVLQGLESVPAMDRYGETNRTDLAYRVGPILFYLIHEVLGAQGFNACLRGFFAASKEGATTSGFQRELSRCSPATQRILDEWFTSIKGLERLQAGESLTELVSSYSAVR